MLTAIYIIPFITLARYKAGIVVMLPVSEKMLRPMLLFLLLAVVISVTETQYSGKNKTDLYFSVSFKRVKH